MKFPKPLSEILRPQKLSDFIGQEHIVGEEGPISKVLENQNLYSMIFWGPPGTGKTSLARIISQELDAHFFEISPTTSGVKDIREIVDKAGSLLYSNKRIILFVDEIHRFNKAQQDYLLPHVENGRITLIGATTENPSFEVVPPLLSRSKVYVFKPLSLENIKQLLKNAEQKIVQYEPQFKISENFIEKLAQTANGDARNIFNTLEALVLMGIKNPTIEDLKKVLQVSFNRYDKKGDEHYDTISAFIKSLRAGDVNAALYYLARMIHANEDPKFIARRMVIFASEDVGLADPKALMIANDVFRACEIIGYPECQINLAHGAVYLAQAPKSRRSYEAYFKALEDAKNLGNLPIPMEVRNAPTKLMENLGYGEGYEMYPDLSKISYLPDKLKGKKYI